MRLLPLALLIVPLVANSASGADLQSSAAPPSTRAATLIFKDAKKSVSLGVSAQLWAVPLVGSDAQQANGDAIDSPGFLARRAGLALDVKLGSDLQFYMNLNPLAESPLDDLRLRWLYRPNMALAMGVAQVPYSASLSQSSSSMRFMERPISSADAAIGRRVGLTAEGNYYAGKLSYHLGVYNGGDDKANNRGGLAFGGRLQSEPFGSLSKLKSKALRLRLGAAAVYDDGPSVNTQAMSADVTIEAAGFRLYAEFLLDERAPDAVPTTPIELGGDVARQTMLIEAGYFVWGDRLELVARGELYDNNRVLTDHGDQTVLTGGANLYFKGHNLKLQMNYIHRAENGGGGLDNDALLVGVAAAL
jgi:hypothetical protein